MNHILEYKLSAEEYIVDSMVFIFLTLFRLFILANETGFYFLLHLFDLGE